jgi:hypothetical protein
MDPNCRESGLHQVCPGVGAELRTNGEIIRWGRRISVMALRQARSISAHPTDDDRDREAKRPSRFEHPTTFRQSVHRIVDMLQRVGMDDEVERGVAVRQTMSRP